MIRRTLLAVFFALVCCGTLAAQEVVEIGDDIFQIASSESTDKGTITEFVPAGETIENWSTLVAVRHFKKLHAPRLYIRNLAEAYRRTMPQMRFSTSRVGKAEAWDIDFILFDPESRTGGFVEWNYFRAERRKFGEGIVVNQYVTRKPYRRSVGEVMSSWDLPSLRDQMLPILRQAEFRIVSGEPAEGEDAR